MSPRTATVTGLVAAALALGVASYAYRRTEPESARVIADTTTSATRRDSTVTPAIVEPPKSVVPPLPDTTTRREPPGQKPAPKPAPKPASPARPHLIRAIPNSALLTMGAAIEVEIRGTGFTATGNAILFGTINGGTVASANGTSIRFIVPTEYPARSEVPPMAVQPGVYPIVVRNANGTSDTLTFTLRSGAP